MIAHVYGDYVALAREVLGAPIIDVLFRAAGGEHVAIDAAGAREAIDSFAKAAAWICFDAEASEQRSRRLFEGAFLALFKTAAAGSFDVDQDLVEVAVLDRIHGHAPGTTALEIAMRRDRAEAYELVQAQVDNPEIIAVEWSFYERELVRAWRDDVSLRVRNCMAMSGGDDDDLLVELWRLIGAVFGLDRKAGEVSDE